MRKITNLLERLNDLAKNEPHRLAYQFFSEKTCQKITYRELQIKAKAFAALLQQYPCYKERAVLLLPPGLDYIIALFGCFYAGMVPVPAYPPRRNHHSERLAAIIANAQAKFIVTHQVFAKQCPSTAYLLTLDSLDENLAQEYCEVSINSSDLAFLQYTSGSTSAPKGVMVNHQNIMVNLEMIQSYLGKNCTSICSWLPPYHDMGLIGGIFASLFLRVPGTLMAPTYFLQSPLRWLEIMSSEKISTSVAPNFAYDLCVKKISQEEIEHLDLSQWHYALNGSEPVRYETLQLFCKKFASAGFSSQALRSVYGLAENTLIATAALPDQWQKPFIVSKTALEQKKAMAVDKETSQAKLSLISCGRPIHHDICIVDSETKLLLPENQIGEIWISGPSVAQGYWNQPDETAATFHATLAEYPQKKYLRTGDLGFIHSDELYISGRIKDLMIVNGLNHYPQDIELTVMQCHPSLQLNAAAAFIVEENNENHLVIMQEVTRTSLSSIDKDAVIKMICSAVLAEHGLQVYGVVLLKPYALPKTSSGKVQRWACRDAYLTKNIPIITDWKKITIPQEISADQFSSPKEIAMQTKDEIQTWLIQWVSNRFKTTAANIGLNTSLAEFGLDSITAAELAADLQKCLQKLIDPLVLLEQRSLGDLIQFLMNTASIETYEIQEESLTLNRASPLIKPSKHPLHELAKEIYFVTTESVSKNTTVINEKEYINFAGYNYLGMSGDPVIVEAAIAAIREYGTSVSASRIASGQKPLHAQLEKSIAELIGSEDCIVYSSGHATNISVITHLFGARDLVVHDALCHNSILQGAIFSGATRIAFPHNEYQVLRDILLKNREHYNKVLIVSEGIFSMDGDIPDVPALIKIKQEFDAFLMLDEAHSIGTLGRTGAGIREYFNLAPQDIDIWMGTLSKAFASCGGYIAGSAELIDHLKYNAAGFVYSAGISPANTAASYAAIKLMQQEPFRVAQLQQRQNLLLSLLKNAGINTGNSKDTPIIPIITEDEQTAVELSLALQSQNIYAIPIMFPAVEKGLARVRLFLNCLHTEEQIYYTASVIEKKYQKMLSRV